MPKGDNVERILLPYFGGNLPKKAQKEAFERIKEDGNLYLLHIVDEAPAKSVRYMTGQLGDNDEFIETFQESRQKLQEKIGEDYTEEVREQLSERNIEVESLYVTGDPVEEIIKVIEEYQVDLVIIESFGEGFREKIAGRFLMDEIDYLRDKAPCEVLTTIDQ